MRNTILLLLLISCSCQKEPSVVIWGHLHNLGSNINSAGKDEHVSFTKDGQTLYFASVREGGMGNYDIYTSTRIDDQWTEAELLPAPVNTPKDEFDVFVTPAGDALYFASNRNNSDQYWDCDIFISKNQAGVWSEPKVLDSCFAVPDKPDWGPTLTEDGLTLIFSSGRAPAEDRSAQIFRSHWTGEAWTKPQPLPEPVNSGGWEATPFITPDGQNLYLNSARGAADKKDVDIWKFTKIGGQWEAATLMKGPLLSEYHDYDPCLAPDGKHFYFTSTRPGGQGGADIWVVEKK